MATLSTDKPAEKYNLLFYLVLLYVVIFYTQPGGRIAFLRPIRIELLTGIAILATLFISGARNRLIDKQIQPYVFFFFVAMCLSFVGAIWTHTASDAWPVLIKLIKFFSIYFMIIGTVDSERKLKLFVWVYLAMILFMIGEPLLKQNFVIAEGGVRRLRGYGQFAHANSLGMNALCNIPFLFFLAAYYRSYFVKIGLALFAVTAAAVAVLTASRTAYVGAAAMVFYIGLFVKHRVRYFGLLAFLGLAAIPVVDKQYLARFMSIIDAATALLGNESMGGSIGARWRIAKASISVFMNYPIFGCGLDSFRRVAAEKHGIWLQSHSLYLQILTNTGIIGAAAFSMFIFHLYRSLIWSKRDMASLDEQDSYFFYLASAVQVFLMVCLTCGLFAQTLYSNIWWISAGLAVVMSRLVGAAAEQAEETTTTEPKQHSKRKHRTIMQSWRDGHG